jgi:hypothetical protein
MTSSISHISEKPWSEYTKADYTPEQWHRSCLIHTHDGAPTSKDQCKLPVRTPNGAINRNGVHAAAAALAGARGGVQASDEQTSKARTSLIRLYGELDEEPPPSLTHSAAEDMAEHILKHYGVKGMKWGVRNSEGGGGIRQTVGSAVGEAKARAKREIAERIDTETHVRAKPGQLVRVVGGNRRRAHEDAIVARTAEQIAKRNTLDALSNKELQHLVQRMNLEQQYRQMAVKETRKSAAQRWVENIVAVKGPLLYAKMGPHAKIGQKVVEGAMKMATQNKALLGGSSEKKKDK